MKTGFNQFFIIYLEQSLQSELSNYLLLIPIVSIMGNPCVTLVLGKFGFKPIQTWFEPKPKPSLGFQFGDFC